MNESQQVLCRAISNLYYVMGKFGIRDRGEIRTTSTFEQLEKVHTSFVVVAAAIAVSSGIITFFFYKKNPLLF